MSGNCRPVGFFDSGVGGISVLKTAYSILPNENYIYYGDNANSPYGDRSETEIKDLTFEACRFLFNEGVKAIVIACNTATSAAVMAMREEFKIPVISMEPAVKPALAEIRSGRILVLATAATVSQERYLKLIERLDAEDKVINIGCSGLVELIEAGHTDKDSIHSYLNNRLQNIQSDQVDAVVIGCTHYSFVEKEIMSFIRKRYNPRCKSFDGRFGTSKQLVRVLDENSIRCDSDKTGEIDFFTSGKPILIREFKKMFDQYQP